MTTKSITTTATDAVEREENEWHVYVGEWYWVQAKDYNKKPYEAFCCVTHVGSNYVQLNSPWHEYRVHFKDFPDECRRELDPDSVINGKTEESKQALTGTLQKIDGMMKELGLAATQSASTEHALVPLTSTENVKQYKNALALAAKDTLPKLQEQLKKQAEVLTEWMTAKTIPLDAEVDKTKGVSDSIKERIFHVELYSGLLEGVVHVAKGKPAVAEEKIHVFQRVCYMDEECLFDYRAGGMNFEKIDKFDKWLAKPVNRDRILPFQKSMVAMCVRRDPKEYEFDGSALWAFIKIGWDQADKVTYIYVRNGDNLYRLDAPIDFGKKLFPDINEFNMHEPLWAYCWSGGSVEDIMPEGRRNVILAEYEEAGKKHDEWCKKWVGKMWTPDCGCRTKYIDPPKNKLSDWDSPYHYAATDHYGSRCAEMEPFNKDSVYYDDIKNKIDSDIKEYNRIVLILQGLLDRSQVLHPHPTIYLWRQEDFENFIKPVFDEDRALCNGPAPDFEAYRASLNTSLKTGSMTIGQEDVWEEREAEKENDRYHGRNYQCHHKRYRPYGNPGPGLVAAVTKYDRNGGMCAYHWTRKPIGYNSRTEEVHCWVKKVPLSRIINVDAYKVGDYKQFFNDPRTRAQYLKWAPMLLTAEDYKAGKIRESDE